MNSPISRVCDICYTLRVGESGWHVVKTCWLKCSCLALECSINYLWCLSTDKPAFEQRMEGGGDKGRVLIMAQKALCCSPPLAACDDKLSSLSHGLAALGWPQLFPFPFINRHYVLNLPKLFSWPLFFKFFLKSFFFFKCLTNNFLSL